MRLEYDLDVGALYIALTDSPVVGTREYGDNANVDLDASGAVVGIEVISAAHGWPLGEILADYPISETDAAQLLAYFTAAVRAAPLPVVEAEPTAPSVLVPA
jgi:uncharacterized protein YuzE